jgi:NhaP-type Na+/H+ or K+/H+ antiporter
MIIIQEALLNDGSALVLFNLFFDSLQIVGSGQYSTTGIALYFIKVIFISPLLGFAFGIGKCSNSKMK